MPLESASRRATLYVDSSEGLKAVKEDFLYWTGRLTDSSFQLSLALIAANWAVFGSVAKILNNVWAKSSLGLVIISLAFNLVGAKWMADLHRRRINYAAEDPERWERDCSAAFGRLDPWPFTKGIDRLGGCLRAIKTWLPLLAGVLFLVALVTAG
jgi:hypothetical protein